MICPILTAGEWVKGSSEPTTVLCLKEECAWWVRYFDGSDECALPAAARELNFLRRGIKED